MIVIGSGIGLTLVEAAARNNRTCALIEQSKLGGTCLTRGCLPSKVLTAPADLVREIQHSAKIGLTCNDNSIRTDWKTIAARMWKQIGESDKIEPELARTPGVTLYKGIGEFTGEKTLRVKDGSGQYSDEITADQIILAPGARTRVPPIPGLEQAGYLTSESFFADAFPEQLMGSIAIIGAGAIGAEFAHIFSAMGVDVTLIERIVRVLPLEDAQVSAFVQANFESLGIDVFVDTTVLSASSVDGHKRLLIQRSGSKETMEISCDEIFIATGIQSNTDLMKLENTHIDLDTKNWIVTSDFLETSRKGIWALGDINGKFQFRHKANYEAEICVHNIFRPDEPRKVNYDTVPWAVFTCPQVAHVGWTESEALALEGRILVGVKHYSSIAKGFALGYEKGDVEDGFVKLIMDKSHRILGAHVAGPQAAVLIQPYVYLMNAGGSCIMRKERTFFGKEKEQVMVCYDKGTTEPITQSMVIHPALSELTAWVIEEMRWVES